MKVACFCGRVFEFDQVAICECGELVDVPTSVPFVEEAHDESS